MDDLLLALGRRPGTWQRLGVVGLCLSVLVGWLVTGQLALLLLPWHPVLTQAFAWGCWFIWQGWRFALRRERYLSANPNRAYAAAFLHDILPGASFAIAQMLRPAVYGCMAGCVPAAWGWYLPGVVLSGAGVALLVSALRTVGLAGAGFVYEYRAAPPALVRQSIYGRIRHPLFLGGVATSLGGAMLAGAGTALWLALVNLAAVPVYGFLEDRRLVRVFGQSYADYRARVGGFIPRSAGRVRQT